MSYINNYNDGLPRVIKPNVRGKNPSFTRAQFILFIPAMKNFIETEQGNQLFETFKSIANGKVFKKMMGDEWGLAMSLLIAHQIVIWAQNAALAERGGGTSISGIAALGQMRGTITSLTVGEVSKSYDHSLTTVINGIDTAYYNQTEYGKQFYLMWAPKMPMSFGLVGGF